ncbi:MAG: polyprenyl diphosphate synthase [Natronomonas sp.]
MFRRLRRRLEATYERLLEQELSTTPDHVAVIQDGNRRYARERNCEAATGHRAGAETTESVLRWCNELGIRELTLYAFSTENFDRPAAERRALFELIDRKLREFAEQDRVHDEAVQIRAIGETDRLPEHLREAIEYAERKTAGYDSLRLNVALAYGGRAELLEVTREIATAAANGEIDPSSVDTAEIEQRLTDSPTRAVDLVVRTGGDERTSNFLPWHANGNEAAVYFCTPYWPEFSRIDFLRALRTYELREASRQAVRKKRAATLVRLLSEGRDPERSMAVRHATQRRSTEPTEADGD